MKKVPLAKLQKYFSSPRSIISFILCIVLAVYIFVCGQGAYMNKFINDSITYGESSSEDKAVIDDEIDESKNRDDDRYKFKISIVDCCLFVILIIVYICKKIHDKRKQKRRTK